MKTKMHVRNVETMIQGTAAAALLAYGIYTLWKTYGASEKVDLEPAQSPSQAHPYFDPHPHHHQEAYMPIAPLNHQRAQGGNAPRERNQIGGRASGKKARY